eukprot:6203573-Pyramimonas_sp.AAC.1
MAARPASRGGGRGPPGVQLGAGGRSARPAQWQMGPPSLALSSSSEGPHLTASRLARPAA